ncbi:hypothetical protein [Helicobacter pylori]|nr:hypothetical protein [Helicobacter pylori]
MNAKIHSRGFLEKKLWFRVRLLTLSEMLMVDAKQVGLTNPISF